MSLLIDNISLINYRCFDNLNISFKGKTTFFYGNNGIGKTSLLEAIFLALTGKKIFKTPYSNLIKKNKALSHINYSSRNSNHSLTITQEKAVFDSKTNDQINTFYLSSLFVYDFFKNRKVRLYTLIKFIGYRDKFFKNKVKELENLIESINFQKDVNSKQFLFLEKEIRSIEKQITPTLFSFVKKLNESSKENLISSEIFLIEKKGFRSNIKTILSLDLTIKNIYGFLNEMSQGQKRTTIISLIIQLIKNNQEIKLILLDDIFDELDKNNKDYICRLCQDFQTIITSSKNLNFSEWIEIDKRRLFNESK